MQTADIIFEEARSKKQEARSKKQEARSKKQEASVGVLRFFVNPFRHNFTENHETVIFTGAG